MAEVLVLVISKIASPLVQEAISQLEKEILKLKELPRKINGISKELSVMKDVILKIGTGTDNLYDEDQWKEWIVNVRTLSYKVEDVLDKYLYYALQRAQECILMKHLVKGAYYAAAFRSIADNMTNIGEEMNRLVHLRDRWLRPDQLPSTRQYVSLDSSPHLVGDNDLVGMDGSRASLTEWLHSAENTYMVITVSGMGGLGKTNLVWNLYEQEKSNFQVHAWIDVSRSSRIFSPEAFLRELIKDIARPLPDSIDSMLHYKLEGELEKEVKSKRCMFVLDDVRDDRAYNALHKVFQTIHNASRIVITTRSRDELASRAPCNRRLELQFLDDRDALNLFCSWSSLDIQKCGAAFRDVANTVVKGCDNHPFGIISVAKKVSESPGEEHYWTETCNQFRYDLAKDNHVRRILYQSYYNLPEDLRNCFLYCSLFPENYAMSREMLVRLWVAEGFVVRKDQNTPEMVAEGYVRKLIHQNMLQPVDIDEFGVMTTCRMHPILRILALSESIQTNFGAANDALTELGESVRRLSASQPLDTNTYGVNCQHLRTLIAVGPYTTPRVDLSSISQGSLYLAVLELQDSSLNRLPDSIENLFNLRYIGLRRTHVASLPESIGRLAYLQTVDVKSTNIEVLPDGINKLRKLRHLFAGRSTENTSSGVEHFKGVASPKGLSGFEELQTLETVESSKDLGKQLEKVEQLSSLSIDNVEAAHCKDLFGSLFMMPRLTSLVISASDLDEALEVEAVKKILPKDKNIGKVQKLVIRGTLAKGTLNALFPHHGSKIKHLELTSCRFGEDPLHLLAVNLPELNHLSLKKVQVQGTDSWVLPSDKFLFLKTLLLTDINDLRRVTIESGAIPIIEALYLDTMPSLVELPEGLNSLGLLKTLCLKNISCVHQLTIQDGTIPRLEALYLDTLSNLRVVPEGLQSLHFLKKLRLVSLCQEFMNEWFSNGWHDKLQHILDPPIENR